MTTAREWEERADAWRDNVESALRAGSVSDPKRAIEAALSAALMLDARLAYLAELWWKGRERG